MKLKLVSKIIVPVLLSMGCFSGLAVARATNSVYTPTFATYTNGDADTYYSGISDSLSGNDLLKALRTLNLNKRQSTVGYSSMGTTPSGQFKYTDYDTNYVQYDSNGQPYGTRISSFYTYTSATSWNREHVWPNSHGGGSNGSAGSPYPDADIHMPRPTISSENSSRGNSFFVEGMNHSSNGWDPYTAGYSAESRGEAARITFYCMTVNSNLALATSNTTPSGKDPITGNTYSSGNTMGNLETLIKWNLNYPVNQREKNRNEGAEYLQGNRNAFVDHPEYVCRIWGSVNSTTQSLCAASSVGVTSISSSSAEIASGSTTTISATSSNGGTISWSTSNSSVCSISAISAASGSSITLTGVSAGSATITASITISGTTYSKTCTVTVTAALKSISVQTAPTKTTYVSGDKFNPAGLVILRTFNDNSSKTLEYSGHESDFSFNPSTTTALTTGNTSVTITYGGKSTTQAITVNESNGYTLVTSNSSLSNGDSVVLTTLQTEDTITGVTGWNGNKDATVSTTESDWMEYTVTIVNNGFTLKDTSINTYIASPSGNEFKYSNSGGTVSAANDGKFVCSNRYLCINGTNYRCYTSVGSYTPFYIYKVDSGSSTPAKTLSSIAVQTAPTKTTYTAGEYFDPTGLAITKTYSDSSSETYTYANHTSEFSFTPSTSTALATNNTSVTIGYGGQTCQQAITVNAAQVKTLTSIAVQTSPTKTSYTVDDTFDPTGLVITRNYSDSTSDTYTYANHTGEFTFSPSLSTPLTTLNTSISITYSGKSCSQAITVQTSGGSGGGSSVDPSDISGTYSLYSGELTEGNYVITYDNKAMQNSVSSNRLAYSAVTPSNDEITNPSASIVWYISQSGGYWTLFNNNVSKYAGGTETYKQGALLSTITDYAKWTVSGDSTYEFENYGRANAASNQTHKYLRENSTYGYACYSSSTGGALTLYKQEVSGSSSSYTGLLENGKYYITNSTSAYGLNGASSGNTPSALTLANITAPFDFTLVGDNLYEISVEINSVTYYLVFNDTSTSSSNTYVRVVSSPSASLKSTYWEITSSGTGYQFRENTTGTTYRYLGCSNTTSWYGYTGTGYGDQVIKVIAADSQSNSVVTQLNDLTCDASGTTAPSKSTWTTIASSITVGAEKTTLQNVTANQSGNALQRAMAKYDYIVGKYGTNNYSDFLGRNPSPLNSGAVLQVAQINDNMLITVVCTMAIVSFLGFTYFLYLKKKRNRE